jgi:hypothetical protein
LSLPYDVEAYEGVKGSTFHRRHPGRSGEKEKRALGLNILRGSLALAPQDDVVIKATSS